jgi:uncharacterized 2Fe-2S/4Fe-4S cluster protein (DUF4445 family)
MIKHTIRLHPLGKEIQVNDQTPLIDILHEFGIEFPCGGAGSCGKCKIRLLKGSIKTTEQHQHKLDILGLQKDWRLACMSLCTDDITLEVAQFSHIILTDESEFKFVPQSGFGVAVDLGTTTIVAQLVDLSNGNVLAVETMLNPQVKYGADLISRIQACIDGHAEEMMKMIRSSIGSMIDQMLKTHDVKPGKIVIVGNTAMQLIFSGSDVTPLSTYPFSVTDLGMKRFQPLELNWDFSVSKEVQFYPSIGSFVGSDILAGIAATGIHTKENYTALIDLGTNGEIVVGNKERIVCASTAAGPAFEGSNISMGMRAVTGAISSFSWANDEIRAQTIGNILPKGICGSALIDAVAILREQDRVGLFGEINSGEDHIDLVKNILLTQKDINEFLLAKAAIAAGLTILVKNLAIPLEDIHEVFIAGGFGNYINLAHVVETGMIELQKEKIHKMGNTALIGAKMFLFDEGKISEEILKKTRHVNLEGDPMFQEIYVDKMLL